MRVVFREVEPWNLWIWAQVRSNMLEDERETLGEVLKAWFILGKLGAFSSSNLQVQRHADQALSISAMPYRIEERDTQACGFHAMGDPEFKGNWMRCWCVLCCAAPCEYEHVFRNRADVGFTGSISAQQMKLPSICSSMRLPRSASSA